MKQSSSTRIDNSFCTLRSRDNHLLLRAQRARQAHATATWSHRERLTKAEKDAVLMHQVWDELAQTASLIARALASGVGSPSFTPV